MFHRPVLSRARGWAFFVVVWAVLPALLPVQVVHAQNPLVESTSLKYIPADASFYSSMMRNREVYDAVVNSKAFAKLLQMPAVQMGIGMIQEQMKDPDSPVAMPLSILEMPENKQALTVLRDMVSNEIFIYGDRGFADTLSVWREMNDEIMDVMGGSLSPDDIEKLEDGPPKEMLDAITKHLAKMQMPDLVIGFKLTDADATETQLKRVEALLTAQLAAVPQLEGRLTRKTVGDSEFLVLALDGSLIPWEEFDMSQMDEEQRKSVEPIIAEIKKKTLVVALGVWKGYLVLSLGDSTEHFETLGQGPRLIEREEFAHVRKVIDNRFTNIGYVSDDLMKNIGSGKRFVDTYAQQANMMLPMLAEPANLDAAIVEQIQADIKELAEDIKQGLPDPGAYLHFSFLTKRGFEGYHYNWSEHLLLDGSQKLTLLDHVGGNPIAFALSRTRYSPKTYDVVVKWIRKLYGYFDTYAVPQLEGEEFERYAKYTNEVLPLLARLDKANREMLIPSLKDGQSACVLDAKITSQQWHQRMPRSEQPLPMLELAVVVGVSDAELLKKAFGEYFAVANALLAKGHESEPDEVPLLKIPPPLTHDLGAGTAYFYLLPKELGFDKKLNPVAGLSESVGVLTLSPRHSRRLLTKTPLDLDSRPLANVDRPLAAASALNFAALIDAIRPWLDYAVKHATDNAPPAATEEIEIDGLDEFGLENDGADEGEDESQPEDGGASDALDVEELTAEEGSSGPNPEMMKMIVNQAYLGMDILKCFRGISSATYFEDDATVTHYEWHYKDLE